MKRLILAVAVILTAAGLSAQTPTFTPSPTPTVTPTPKWFIAPKATLTPPNTCLTGDPCTAAVLKTKAYACGDNIQIMDGNQGVTGLGTGFSGGHYVDADDMLSGFSKNCTSATPLRFGVQHPFKSLIDGSYARAPILLNGATTSGIWIEGGLYVIGQTASTASTGNVAIANGSHDNRISRVISMNADNPDTTGALAGQGTKNKWSWNHMDFSMSGSGSINNVLSEFGCLGFVRKCFQSFSNAGPNYARLGLIALVPNLQVGPKHGITMSYDSFQIYAVDNYLVWDETLMPSNYTLKLSGQEYIAYTGPCSPNPGGDPPGCLGSPETKPDQPYGHFGVDHAVSQNINAKAYGNLIIQMNSDKWNPTGPQGTNAAHYSTNVGAYDIKDEVIFIDSGHSTKKPFSLNSCAACVAPKNLTITDATSIGGATSTIHSDWTKLRVVTLPNASTFKYDGSSGASTANIRWTHLDDGRSTLTERWPIDPVLNQAMIDGATYIGQPPVDFNARARAALGAFPTDASTPTPTNTPTITPTPTATSSTPSPTPTQTPTLGLCIRHYRRGSASRIWYQYRTLCFDNLGQPSPDWVTLATPTPTPP